MNSKKRNRILIILIVLFIVLTIILVIPKKQLLSTKTYELIDFSINITSCSYSYIDENNQVITDKMSFSEIKEIIYLSEQTNQVTVENWGYGEKTKERKIVRFYLDFETYKHLTNDLFFTLPIF